LEHEYVVRPETLGQCREKLGDGSRLPTFRDGSRYLRATRSTGATAEDERERAREDRRRFQLWWSTRARRRSRRGWVHSSRDGPVSRRDAAVSHRDEALPSREEALPRCVPMPSRRGTGLSHHEDACAPRGREASCPKKTALRGESRRPAPQRGPSRRQDGPSHPRSMPYPHRTMPPHGERALPQREHA
jgi:hypothetical protein